MIYFKVSPHILTWSVATCDVAERKGFKGLDFKSN